MMKYAFLLSLVLLSITTSCSTHLRSLQNLDYVEDHPAIITGEAQNVTGYHRGLLTSSRSILVLRITNGNKAPSVSASTLKQYLFTHTNSLNSQMKRCSANALSFYPSNYGNGGVVDVRVDTSHTAQPIINAALRDGATAVGVANLRLAADHVVLVLPEVSNYFATAEVGNVFSFFNNENAASLSVLMHEIGHNLNLHHAGLNGDEYGDYSGNMGRSKVMRGGPLLCFNAANHWSLGWFPNGRKDFGFQGPATPQKFELAGFVDYQRTSKPVMARVGDMYMQYNLRKDYNKDSDELVNQLVIVSLGVDKKTTVQGSLSVGQEFSHRTGNFKVKVCSASNDAMTISLGKSSTNCNGSTSTSNRPVPTPSFSWGNNNAAKPVPSFSFSFRPPTAPTPSFWSSPTSKWPPVSSPSPPVIKWGSERLPDSEETNVVGEDSRAIAIQEKALGWSNFACILGGC